jgi:hypothetical protein
MRRDRQLLLNVLTTNEDQQVVLLHIPPAKEVLLRFPNSEVTFIPLSGTENGIGEDVWFTFGGAGHPESSGTVLSVPRNIPIAVQAGHFNRETFALVMIISPPHYTMDSVAEQNGVMRAAAPSEQLHSAWDHVRPITTSRFANT